VRTASAVSTVPIGPDEAMRLWTDVDRWPSFVEGFARRLELSPGWPAKDARVVWESNPDGRGRVTETVTESEPLRFSTQVFEERLIGTQTFQAAHANEGSEVALSLDYELTRHGPLRGLVDAIFIRRALRDSLRRTLFRFEVEAEEEADLR
jgi:Polyketide cyclase / dehydrase and lipid transport